jgi:hypothetical protein
MLGIAGILCVADSRTDHSPLPTVTSSRYYSRDYLITSVSLLQYNNSSMDQRVQVRNDNMISTKVSGTVWGPMYPYYDSSCLAIRRCPCESGFWARGQRMHIMNTRPIEKELGIDITILVPSRQNAPGIPVIKFYNILWKKAFSLTHVSNSSQRPPAHLNKQARNIRQRRNPNPHPAVTSSKLKLSKYSKLSAVE